MPVAQNILKLSSALWWVSTGLILVLPLVVIFGIARGLADPEILRAAAPIAQGVTPGSGAILLAGLVAFLPLAALIYALVEMRRLFARYGRGEILSHACAAHIQGIGQGLLAAGLLGIFAATLRTVMLTWSNPPGERVLSVGLGTGEIGFFFAAALMILIGRVMREAARVAEENARFV